MRRLEGQAQRPELWRRHHSAAAREAADQNGALEVTRAGSSPRFPGPRLRRPKRRGLDPEVLDLEIQGLVVGCEESSRFTLVPARGV